MISDYSPIEMKEEVIQSINETSHSVYLEFLLLHITLLYCTGYFQMTRLK